MFIQCPQCRTHNDISENLLQSQEEVITCRHCHLEFTLTLTPVNNERPDHPDADKQHEASPQPALNVNISQEELSRLSAETPPQQHANTATQQRIAAWSAGIALMLLLFVGQFSYFKRDDLSRHVALRPWLEFVCNFSGCTVPLMRDRKQIRLIARHVADHPDVNDALMVTLTMVNDANFPQPYPKLKLGFADLNNRTIAQRVFEPGLYLPEQINQEKGMKPGTPVTVLLALVDPGKNAVNFEFEIK